MHPHNNNHPLCTYHTTTISTPEKENFQQLKHDIEDDLETVLEPQPNPNPNPSAFGQARASNCVTINTSRSSGAN
jgi:hypothetical protein